MSQHDTYIIEKAKGTIAKIILGAIVLPIVIYATIWLFTTTIATSKTVALVADGMGRMVKAVEGNTIAVKDMGINNEKGHGEIALMVYGIKEQIAVGQTRLSNVENVCYTNHDDIKEHTTRGHK